MVKGAFTKMIMNSILSEQKIIVEPFYVAKEIKGQLTHAKRIVTESDQDRVYVVTGREGQGKSTLAMQLAYTVDPTFNLQSIVFTSSQFEERIRNLSKHKVLMFDEAFNGLSSKGSLSRENKNLVRILTECRQRNLFIFIVLPSIFLLEKYVAIFRSHALFNVGISRKNFKNRFYKVYNYSNKKLLYIAGKQMMSYTKPKVTKSYRFYGKLPPTIIEQEYRDKKLNSFMVSNDEDKQESRQGQQRNYLMHLLNTQFKMPAIEISRKLERQRLPLDYSVICKVIKGQSQKMASGGGNVYNNNSEKKAQKKTNETEKEDFA